MRYDWWISRRAFRIWYNLLQPSWIILVVKWPFVCWLTNALTKNRPKQNAQIVQNITANEMTDRYGHADNRVKWPRNIFTSNGTQLSHAIFVKVLMRTEPTQYLSLRTHRPLNFSVPAARAAVGVLNILNKNRNEERIYLYVYAERSFCALRIKFGVLFSIWSLPSLFDLVLGPQSSISSPSNLWWQKWTNRFFIS